MTPTATIKAGIAVLAVVAAALGAAWFYSHGKTVAEGGAARTVVKQQQTAVIVSRSLQDKVNEANTRLREREAARADARARLDAAERELREQPGAGAAAGASIEALREYAEGVERDFAECRAEVAALADEAAGASDAAHALSESWPDLAKWRAASGTFNQYAKELTK